MVEKLFVINGYATVGKDSFVRSYSLSTNVVNYSSIALVKRIGQLCGIDPNDKSEKNRRWWSDMKIFLTMHGDIPFKDVVREITKAEKRLDKVSVFIHVREAYDIKKLKEAYPDSIALLIKNDRVKPVTSNAGDAGVLDYEYDIEVSNNGTIDELNHIARALYEYVELKKAIPPRFKNFIVDNRVLPGKGEEI